jgi:tetratricopeptide (TPR) repeat protein
MTRRSHLRRTRLAQLLLGVAPALLIAAASPAYAWGVSGSLRRCEAQNQRHIERAIQACDAVIDNERRSTLTQIQRALAARANMRVTRNDLTGAAADLERARRLGAADSTTFVALGQVQARLNDPDAALANFAAASAAAGEDDDQAVYDASLASAAIQLERGQWAQAIQSYTRAYERASDGARQARALIGRGHARLGDGHLDAALIDYISASERDPNSVEALIAVAEGYRAKNAGGDAASFGAARQRYESALTKLAETADSAEQRRMLARIHAGRGELYLYRFRQARDEADLRQASTDFEDAVEADTQNVRALVGRASVYAETAPTRAVADLDRAVRLAPNDPEIHRARGDLFALIGDNERAMRDYDQALQHGGAQSYRTYYQRGVIYMDAGDYVRADQSFAQAAALARHGHAPPGMDSNAAIAEALAMRSRATWNLIDMPGFAAREVAVRARDYADEAARWQPNQARYEAGRCLTRSVAGGEWEVAERACQSAIQLARDGAQRSEAFGAMGMLQLRWALAGAPNGASEATHLQHAANHFARAVDADPQNTMRAALYRYAQGVALECLGRQVEANALMRDALNHDRSVEARFLTHRIRHCRA